MSGVFETFGWSLSQRFLSDANQLIKLLQQDLQGATLCCPVVWERLSCVIFYSLHTHTPALAQILETVEQINTIKLQREFYLGFAQNPQKFINEWLASQSRDLKVVYSCGVCMQLLQSTLH